MHVLSASRQHTYLSEVCLVLKVVAPSAGFMAMAPLIWNLASVSQPSTSPGFSVSRVISPVSSLIRYMSKTCGFLLFSPTSTYHDTWHDRSTPTSAAVWKQTHCGFQTLGFKFAGYLDLEEVQCLEAALPAVFMANEPQASYSCTCGVWQRYRTLHMYHRHIHVDYNLHVHGTTMRTAPRQVL